MAPSNVSIPGEYLKRPIPLDLCFKISIWISLRQSLGVFETASSVLGLGVSEFAHEPFKTCFSFCYWPLGLVYVCHVSFQSQIFWGLVSQMQVLKVAVLCVGYIPFIPKGKAPSCEFPPDCRLLHPGGEVYGKTVSQPLLRASMWQDHYVRRLFLSW